MKRIAVIGAGTMGHGIAQVAAMAAYDVTLTDARPGALAAARVRIEANLGKGVEHGKVTRQDADKAMARIRTVDRVQAAVRDADLVVEAVLEDLDVKRSLFADLDRLTAATAVLATNTSSLSIARIAEAVRRPGRVIGMHFFNPVHLMKLVELVMHEGTDPATLETAREVALRMGKDPIVAKDRPGFASSRLGVVLGLEAMRMLEEGIASAEDIDKAMELGYGHPMGPLKVSDLVGLDVRLAIAEYLHRELGAAHYAPPDVLRRKVEAGELGKKTGRGFHSWPSNRSS